MSKTLGAIFRATYGPGLGFAVDGTKGLLQGFTNAAAASSGPLTYGLYVAGAAIGSLQKSPRAEQTETAIKASVTPRVSGYGKSRGYFAMELVR